MGKSSKASLPPDTAFDKGIKQAGPGLTNTSPILQLTLPGSMPGFGGQVPMGGNFAQQMAGLPPGLLEQIRKLQAGPVQSSPPMQAPTLPPLREGMMAPNAPKQSFDLQPRTLPAYGLRRG